MNPHSFSMTSRRWGVYPQKGPEAVSFLGIALLVVALAVPAWAQATGSTPATGADARNEVWDSFFPDGLLTASGDKATTDDLKGKVVGIYFSAHWCPPCRAFSPSLVKFRNENKSDFEVVFVSSDKSEDAQFEYMKELKMEWFAVKYKSDAANKLKEKYGIQSIPTLVVLSPNGETISTDGRGEVTSSPDQCLANWKQKASLSPTK